ncbi:hypothetical protein Godav_022138 [Gossypium davidsonii]|uniref:Uncharacterized protein n=2 Tax=Gossypium TaxID=3633 RepID=A0A7J8THR5_GOSDV|nr:hypothetical protein [Gossypium davidsonii]MBA0673072.1 hypothetical protein [Gossypium klotzschianum]
MIGGGVNESMTMSIHQVKTVLDQ